MKILFWVMGFVIFWAMIGYPIFVKCLGKVFGKKRNVKNYDLRPSVTIMVVAHNEEQVILEKLNNLLNIDYDREKLKIIIASDNSDDKTNEIVRRFIKEHKECEIQLYEVRERKGKTNAQNEAYKLVDTEFLVMTDANSMLDRNAVSELMASFSTSDIAYVSGALKIVNKDVSDVSSSENSYWDSDLEIREIESNIKTITAGNGALYACRSNEYIEIDLIESHDSAMPIHYGLEHKRAIANHDAIAYEKAGENIGDEFGRKVRMNRVILKHIIPDIHILNIFSYGWFSVFYFGHRTCRYLLWLSHLIVLITSGILMFNSSFFCIVFVGQVLFYLLAIIKLLSKINNRLLNLVYYYTVTIIAQWCGVLNIISGKAKPFWEKAESTR